jgi:hypothetical protein
MQEKGAQRSVPIVLWGYIKHVDASPEHKTIISVTLSPRAGML